MRRLVAKKAEDEVGLGSLGLIPTTCFSELSFP
jgi:hypothetical protein